MKRTSQFSVGQNKHSVPGMTEQAGNDLRPYPGLPSGGLGDCAGADCTIELARN